MAAEQQLLASLQQTLQLTNGTMPVAIRVPDQETADWLQRQARGRKHTAMVSFRVTADTTNPSIKEKPHA